MNKWFVLGACFVGTGWGEMKVKTFSPKAPVKTFTTSSWEVGGMMVRSRPRGMLHSAQQFVKAKLGFGTRDYIVKSMYTSKNGLTHVYLRQKVDGKEVFNANINLNLDSSGNVISFGDSFYRPKTDGRGRGIADKFPTRLPSASITMTSFLNHIGIEPMVPVTETVSDFASGSLVLENVPGVLSQPKAMLGWLQVESEELEPVWDLKVEFKEDYFHAHVSPFSQQPIAIHNWVKQASYRVFRFRMNDPSEGHRDLEVDPWNPEASPLGWHDNGDVKSTDTSGNNVIAVNVTAYDTDETEAFTRVSGGENLEFDFPFNDTQSPSTYQKAAITNLFYWNNQMHDLYYRYGFDEQAGNFQQNNFGKGGVGGDPVIAHGQDPSATNNAYFTTPPDGESGRMQMFLFDIQTPLRDGDFDSGIMVHEYTHGLSTRLTGGPTEADCLDDDESGGMGEGWGDIIATMLRTRTTYDRHTDLGIGYYVLGKPTIRTFVYSTNMTTNPETFSLLGREFYKEVHNAGQVWAVILYEVFWNLIDKLGFTIDWIGRGGDDPSQYGNTLMLQLIIDGMKIQPCNPTFLDARDAILQAEKVYTKGIHACELWKGFAKRGMGIHAKVDLTQGEESHTDSFDIPEECS